MKLFLNIILAAIAAAAVVSCADNNDFRVIGSIDGLGTQNLRVAYVTAKGVTSFTTTAIDGKFSFTGRSPQPTLMEIFTTNRTPLITTIVRNGDALEIEMDINRPNILKIKGDDDARQLASFMEKHHDLLHDGPSDKLNAVIADFASSNRKSFVSAILLLTRFNAIGHEAEADSLLGLLSDEAAPAYLVDALSERMAEFAAADTIGIRPMRMLSADNSIINLSTQGHRRTLFAVTRSYADRAGMDQRLKSLSDSNNDSLLNIIDICITTDTASWHKMIAADDASWTQTWAPGGTASEQLRQLHIPRLPFFVVTDSLGRQLYRGADLGRAAIEATR